MKINQILIVILFIKLSFISFGQTHDKIIESTKNLTIEEYKIVLSDIDKPDHMKFLTRIDTSILEKRKKWRKFTNTINDIDYLNSQLNHFNYRFEKNKKPSSSQPSYNFFYNDSLIIPALSYIDIFNLNKNKDKFFFIASQPLEYGPPYRRNILCYNGNITEWKATYYFPVFVNNTFMFADEKNVIKIDSFNNGRLLENDLVTVYSFDAPMDLTSPTVKYFCALNDDWILEYKDNVIISGENISEKNNYEKAFHYCIIKDKPFYFIEKDNRIYISYNGKIYPNTYDKVIHYECCEPAFFNIYNNENMVWFYALKNGFWYYVEAGIYDK